MTEFRRENTITLVVRQCSSHCYAKVRQKHSTPIGRHRMRTTNKKTNLWNLVILWICFVNVRSSTPLRNPTPSPSTLSPTRIPTIPPPTTNLWNFCNRMGSLPNASANNPINSKTALNGMVVNIGVNLDAPKEFIQFGTNYWNQSVVIGGYMYFIHQELARRGGFTVNYVIVGNISSFTNTVDFVYHQLSSYPIDIYGGAPVSQSSNGVKSAFALGYTRQLMDVSVILISPEYISTGYTMNNIWSFVAPFNVVLWITLIAAIFIFGAVLWGVERWLFTNYRPIGEISAQDQKIMSNVNAFIPLHLAFYTGCLALGDQESAIEPRHLATRIMMLAFKFCIVMFSSAYLANLANLLVLPAPIIIKVPDLSTAIATQTKLCVLTGDNPKVCFDCFPGSGTPFSIVNASYPKANLVQIKSSKPVDLLMALNNGQCDAALMTKAQWDFNSNVLAANPNCNLVQTEVTIRQVSGVFPVINDFSKFNTSSSSSLFPTSRCTALIPLTFSTLLSDMRGDGTLKFLYGRAESEHWDQSCTPMSGAPSGSNELQIGDLGGVFFLYTMACILALVIALVINPITQYFRRQRQLKQNADTLEAETNGQDDNKVLSVIPAFPSRGDVVPINVGSRDAYDLSGEEKIAEATGDISLPTYAFDSINNIRSSLAFLPPLLPVPSFDWIPAMGPADNPPTSPLPIRKRPAKGCLYCFEDFETAEQRAEDCPTCLSLGVRCLGGSHPRIAIKTDVTEV